MSRVRAAVGPVVAAETAVGETNGCARHDDHRECNERADRDLPITGWGHLHRHHRLRLSALRSSVSTCSRFDSDVRQNVKPSRTGSASMRLTDACPMTNRSHSHGVGSSPSKCPIVTEFVPACATSAIRRSGSSIDHTERPCSARWGTTPRSARNAAATGVDPGGELTNRLTAVEAVPTMLDGPVLDLGVGLLGLLGRRAVPQRIADLLQPRIDRLVTTEPFEERRSGLSGSCERRHEHLVEGLIGQLLGHRPRLAMAEFGQGRIGHVSSRRAPTRAGRAGSGRSPSGRP